MPQASPSQDNTGMVTGLADKMKQATMALHETAENSGIVKDMLNQTVSLEAYSIYLRNLLPIYSALETSDMVLENILKSFLSPNLHRKQHIAADLTALTVGLGWQDLPIFNSTIQYIEDIRKAQKDDPMSILGHIYVRYLGDLHGGQILKKLLQRQLALPASCLSFYEFPAVNDLASFRVKYRADLNAFPTTPATYKAIVDTSIRAFKLNIAVSNAIKTHGL